METAAKKQSNSNHEESQGAAWQRVRVVLFCALSCRKQLIQELQHPGCSQAHPATHGAAGMDAGVLGTTSDKHIRLVGTACRRNLTTALQLGRCFETCDKSLQELILGLRQPGAKLLAEAARSEALHHEEQFSSS